MKEKWPPKMKWEKLLHIQRWMLHENGIIRWEKNYDILCILLQKHYVGGGGGRRWESNKAYKSCPNETEIYRTTGNKPVNLRK